MFDLLVDLTRCVVHVAAVDAGRIDPHGGPDVAGARRGQEAPPRAGQQGVCRGEGWGRGGGRRGGS